MKEIHCTASVIRAHLQSIFNYFGLSFKIKCAVTDNGGAIPAAFEKPEEENEQGLCVNRFPCI